MKKVIMFFLITGILFSAGINDLKMYTEQYPPYNYENEKTGKLEGIMVDVVEYILEDNNSSLTKEDINLVPWARGYNETLNRKNTVIFGITFTEERKPKFKWAGPVIKNRVVLKAKKEEEIEINGVEDMKDYKIGVVRDDIAQQLLEKMGVPDKNLYEDATPKLNARKLNAERIDIWAYEENVASYTLRSEGYNPNDYESIYLLKEGELFIGFNKDTSDEIVNKFQKSIEKLKTKDKDVYDKILEKYVK
ncbi:MAG: substrate-binding periplasmic protein [Fusobacteriota bacterium]